MSEGVEAAPAPVRWRWLRRFGVAGFLFFLVKGLLWLALPVFMAWGLFGAPS